MKNLKTILINDRYLIYANDGCVYDGSGGKDIPHWVFELRDKILQDRQEVLDLILKSLPEEMDEGSKRTEQPITDNKFAFIAGFNSVLSQIKNIIINLKK